MLWHCFPWDPDAAPEQPFSPSHLAPGQTVGRFDLHDRPPVRYLPQSAEHAIGEQLAPFRGTDFRPAYLRQQGHPLALAEITLTTSLASRVVDCTDPAVLAERQIRPDDLAHHDRSRTQAIARRLHDDGGAGGLRWWSALTGAWHTVVIFTDREALCAHSSCSVSAGASRAPLVFGIDPSHSRTRTARLVPERTT